MCTISKDIGINKEIEVCAPSKESLSGHRCERRNMPAKCEIFMDCSENFISICKKKYNWQTWDTKGIIDVKEEIWFTNIKYLRLST